MNILERALQSVKPVCEASGERLKNYWDSLAHPPGSLGSIEEMTIQLAKIQKTDTPSIDKKITVVFCADNGVYAEQITSQPQITTFLLAEIMHTGKTGLGAISKWANSDIAVYDVGMIKSSAREDIINKKLRSGTNNIAVGPAMTRDECSKIIEAGIEASQEIAEKGYSIAGIGELGICNTTTTAAVLSSLCSIPPEQTVGRGASTTKEMYNRKIKAVKKALEINKPKAEDPIDCISKVGGFDIAAMCGCYLGLCAYGIPCVIDGYISSVAALCAAHLNPAIKGYLFASHKSQEQGAQLCLSQLGIHPILDMKMRLGEGSGCPILFNMLEGALFTLNNMGKFKDTLIKSDDLVDIRK